MAIFHDLILCNKSTIKLIISKKFIDTYFYIVSQTNKQKILDTTRGLNHFSFDVQQLHIH